VRLRRHGRDGEAATEHAHADHLQRGESQGHCPSTWKRGERRQPTLRRPPAAPPRYPPSKGRRSPISPARKRAPFFEAIHPHGTAEARMQASGRVPPQAIRDASHGPPYTHETGVAC
jgi:hypothetical protein